MVSPVFIFFIVIFLYILSSFLCFSSLLIFSLAVLSCHLTCSFRFGWVFLFLFLRWSFALVQAGVQWHDVGSLQPPPPRYKQFSCLSLLSSLNCRHVPPCLANFFIFSRDGACATAPGPHLGFLNVAVYHIYERILIVYMHS
uniref:Uncharacterized protein n=1 Tax=Macaca fascicularis TaxID=9541 RepID=A0A7N9D1T8_MACFA